MTAKHTKRSKRAKASEKEITSIGTSSQSSENAKTYRRRMAQKDYQEIRRKKERRKKRIIAAVSTVGVLLIAAAIGAWAYIHSIDLSLRGDTSVDITNQLTSTKLEDPFYMVLIGQDARPGETQTRSDTLMLAYINPPDKKITIVSIPRDSRVEVPGHGLTKINAASAYGGPALTIQTVSNLVGVDISHYAEVNFNDFSALVDEIGGVEVDVPVKISDTKAGPSVLEPGVQTLNGEQALTLCRSRKFPTGDFQRVKNQQIFLKALAKKVLSIGNPIKLANAVSAMAKSVDTDLGVNDIRKLASSYSGMDFDKIETVTVPGTTQTIDGVSYVIINDEEFTAMMTRIKNGEPADPEKAAAQKTDSPSSSSNSASAPSSVSVAVRNGAGVSGVAGEAADILTKKGYKISETGNAAQFVYDETLVVYNDGGKDNAEAIVKTLGVGKTVPSRGMYSFTGDLLVVVGKDWKPK